ncbi:serine palmitoyltransferase small subunit A [Galleria mellonella]|uniref:Serine palmitoyltransferase small subunit A n=1 Tax=Galleria mellonella TaxID=7137 RepID=A0ABM3M970_GALME|nr:serine palmitoyltransferase small subunit A [Galleria mellonella]
MSNAVKKVKEFFSYWYLRYLLVTELYMVEPWEKVVIQLVFALFFGLYWYFNYSIVMYGVSHLRGTLQHTI